MTTSVLVLVACGAEDRLAAKAPLASVVHVADDRGVNIFDTQAGRVLARVDHGVAAGQWVFDSELTPGGSRLRAIGADGTAAWDRSFDEELVPRVAAADGRQVALLPAGLAHIDAYHPTGRAGTRVVVASTQAEPDQAYDLIGNFEPEAFTRDGTALFLIEYLPARHPDRYRVRKLDLASGDIGAVPSVDGHLQDSMRGTARVHAFNADASRLYTLYTTDGVEGPHAFVHVLDLEEGWAHCVDLPARLQATPESHLAIAAGAPGAPVVVVDDSGFAVRIDPDTLLVSATNTFAGIDQPGGAQAVLGRHGEVYVARGGEVVTLAPDGSVQARWRAPGATLALVPDPARSRLWQLTYGYLYALDPHTGAVRQSVAAPGTYGAPPLDGHGQPIQCAC